MTNYEKIKQMSVEEMAEFLNNITISCWRYGRNFEEECCVAEGCKNCMLFKMCCSLGI